MSDQATKVLEKQWLNVWVSTSDAPVLGRSASNDAIETASTAFDERLGAFWTRAYDLIHEAFATHPSRFLRVNEGEVEFIVDLWNMCDDDGETEMCSGTLARNLGFVTESRPFDDATVRTIVEVCNRCLAEAAPEAGAKVVAVEKVWVHRVTSHEPVDLDTLRSPATTPAG